MLQIISGKFFRTDKRHTFEAYGILYSNVAIWQPVQTSVATIHPVDPHGSVARYVISYTNQIEREAQDEKGFGLVRTGDAEIIDQLTLLAGFGFRGFFSPNRSEVEHVCRSRRAMAGDYVPSQLVDRFCDSRISAENDDLERFATLVDATIGLRRKTYVAVMEYLRNFFGSLRAVDENLDLAYSMLVYGLEALSQQFGKFEPKWEAVEDKVRNRVDEVLAEDPTRLAAVREALLQSKSLRIRQRLIAFVEGLLPDDLFLGSEQKSRKLPLRYSDLSRAMRNAYDSRSSFVHELKRGKQLNAFAEYDVLKRQNEPHFSFRGLARVAEAVVRRFVAMQGKVASEDIDWRSELPGLVTAEMHPKYWIWRVDNFRPEHARQRLSAFLWELEEEQVVTDLHELLAQLADHICRTKGAVEDRRAMAALYLMYHVVVQTSHEQSDEVVQKREELLRCPSIESFLLTLILGRPWNFTTAQLEEIVSSYQAQKYRKLGLTFGAQVEAAILAYAGNRRRESDDQEAADAWLRRAVLELVGHSEKQQYIRQCCEKKVAVDVGRVIRPWKDEEVANPEALSDWSPA